MGGHDAVNLATVSLYSVDRAVDQATLDWAIVSPAHIWPWE